MDSNKILPLWVQLLLTFIPTISAIAAAIGLYLNYRQARRNNEQARHSIVAASLSGFAADEEITKVYYDIEWDLFRYDQESFSKSRLELGNDKLLRHFSNLALAWQAGLLTIGDIRPASYYVVTIMRNAEIRRYLSYLESETAKDGLDEHPFVSLIKLAERLSPQLRSD